MMDKEPEDIISEHLGERATKIAASPVCAAGRDRLLWFDFQLQPLEDESLIKGTTRNELILEPDAERLDFWDEGWGPTHLFDGTMPTVQGWQTWTKEPKDPRGIHIRSKEALPDGKRTIGPQPSPSMKKRTWLKALNLLRQIQRISESSAPQKQRGFSVSQPIGHKPQSQTAIQRTSTTNGRTPWEMLLRYQLSQGC